VYRIRSEQGLENVPDGAVLVAPHSSPRLSQVMTRCAAIITEQGSPTGHMAILAREFNVPTIVALRDADRVLEHGRTVTVDARECRVHDGRVESILSAGDAAPPFADTPAVRKLRRIARHITPLHLIEPTSPEFVPSGCRSLHDVTRFVHEKLFDAMFHFADKAAREGVASARLDANLPYVVHVFDLGGGFADGAGTGGSIAAADVRSVPLRAFLEGLQDPRIRWDQPRAVSGHGFLSVVGEAMMSPPAEARGVGMPSFATVSDRYMNFSTKAGYHFNTVDTWCGNSLNKNYIHFRFEGGGANEERRARRCRFLTIVLTDLGFKVVLRGDVVLARVAKHDREFLLERLVHLGRLTLCARQLDMLMDDEQSPETFAGAFLAGEMEQF
jgi:pyruvate,water dikinase